MLYISLYNDLLGINQTLLGLATQQAVQPTTDMIAINGDMPPFSTLAPQKYTSCSSSLGIDWQYLRPST